MKTLRQLLPLLLAMAGLLLLFGVLVRNFLNPENMLDLVQQISVNAILAFGMTLVILIGGIDLSVGALVAVTGTTTVWVLTRNPDAAAGAFWLLLAVLAGLGAATAFGFFNGVSTKAGPCTFRSTKGSFWPWATAASSGRCLFPWWSC
jgi:ribose transport system permease protein